MAQKKRSINVTVPSGVFVLALLVLIAVPTIYSFQYSSVATVFEDVVSYGRLAPLVGFMSDLGVSMWLATAVLLLHGLHRLMQHADQVNVQDVAFYLTWTMILLFLALDDRLLLHEWMSDSLGIAEWKIMTVYAGVVMAASVIYRKYLLGETRYWIIIAGLAFFISVIVDLRLIGPWLDGFLETAGQDVLEEGAKWVGICALFLHIFVLTTHLPQKLRHVSDQ